MLSSAVLLNWTLFSDLMVLHEILSSCRTLARLSLLTLRSAFQCLVAKFLCNPICNGNVLYAFLTGIDDKVLFKLPGFHWRKANIYVKKDSLLKTEGLKKRFCLLICFEFCKYRTNFSFRYIYKRWYFLESLLRLKSFHGYLLSSCSYPFWKEWLTMLTTFCIGTVQSETSIHYLSSSDKVDILSVHLPWMEKKKFPQ